MVFYIYILYERPPRPPTIRNSYTRTLVLDTTMKLSGTIGVTQKSMTLDTHVCLIFEFEDIHHSSSKIISARNEASKNIQKLCAKSKTYEHTSKIRTWKAAQNDDQNDDRTMTIFLVYEFLQTHAHREPKMASLLERNHSIHFHCCCSCRCFFFCCCSAASATATFQSLAHFISTNTKPSGTMGDTWGHTKNDDHFSHVLSRIQ